MDYNNDRQRKRVTVDDLESTITIIEIDHDDLEKEIEYRGDEFKYEFVRSVIYEFWGC